MRKSEFLVRNCQCYSILFSFLFSLLCVSILFMDAHTHGTVRLKCYCPTERWTLRRKWKYPSQSVARLCGYLTCNHKSANTNKLFTMRNRKMWVYCANNISDLLELPCSTFAYSHTQPHTDIWNGTCAVHFLRNSTQIEGCCILFSGANKFTLTLAHNAATVVAARCVYLRRTLISWITQVNWIEQKENSFNFAPIFPDAKNSAARGRNVNRAVNYLTPHFSSDV